MGAPADATSTSGVADVEAGIDADVGEGRAARPNAAGVAASSARRDARKGAGAGADAAAASSSGVGSGAARARRGNRRHARSGAELS